MKTFNDFLKEQVIEEEGLRDFLKDNGLEDEWKEFKNKPKPITAPPENAKGWKLSGQEAMRDISRIVNDALGSTTKVNKFGIESIKFEVISTEHTSSGIKIDLEAQGTASARNGDHIKKQLEKVMATAKAPLAEKGIHMEFLYNKIDTNDAMEEANLDEPAIGLVRKIDFRIVCTAIINAAKHKHLED